jgi:CubicO group peptidase (beta-lactamase class C family)
MKKTEERGPMILNISALALEVSRILLCCIMATSLMGCTTPGNGFVAPVNRGPGPIGPDELEAFTDKFFGEQMDELHIPGLTFIFVQDGKVLLARGYGSANPERGIPFNPDETVVRVGSVSKLFVATAVVQLVERGELDLRADVNQYLSAFQLDDNYPEPVTLAHLLTHTGGFDSPPYWTTINPTELQSLGLYLTEHMPPRIISPGEVLAYSGHGYDLAAHVVEQVSGIPFDQYVEQHILQPLGMEQSGYLLSPPMPDGLAVGYAYEGGVQIPQPIDYEPGYPSGSFVSTAADMAKFMLAHLQNGCYQDTCILRPETIAMMHQQQFTNHPQLAGWTYGFAEGFENNQRWIGHGGAIRGFGSDLTLLPEHNLGYFFSFNEECWRTGACKISQRFREQFFDHFFPSDSQALPVYTSTTDLARLTGRYRHVRYPHSAIYETGFSPFDILVTKSNGHILVDDVEYGEIAPLVFQEVGGAGIIAFRGDDEGDITYMFMFSSEAFEKLDQ